MACGCHIEDGELDTNMRVCAHSLSTRAEKQLIDKLKLKTIERPIEQAKIG